MIKFIAGVAVGAAGFWLYQRWFSGGGQVALPDGSKSILHGTIVPLSSSGSPADAGLEPKAGYRSREGYEWGYKVGDGDSAGDIARAITGDDGRYQELIGANPHLKTVGLIGVYNGDKSWEFAPGELRKDIGLLLPLPWSRYIDQLGNVRGGLIPFPEDPRSKTGASVSGSSQRTIIAPPLPARGDGFSPYGRVVALSEIPQERAA